MKTTLRLQLGRIGLPAGLLVAMLVIFALLVLRVVTTTSPLMPSDEYAFISAAKYQSWTGEIYKFDPQLQAVENKIYPGLYWLWDLYSPSNAISVGRIFNVICYLLGVLFLYPLLHRIFGRETATASSVGYLLFPFSFYAVLLMPEVEYQLLTYAVMLAILWGNRKRDWAGVVGAGILSASCYLTKPHAVALILATFAFLLIRPLIVSRDGKTDYRKGLLAAMLYVVTTLTIVSIVKLTFADVQGGKSFYAGYIDRLEDPQFLLANLSQFLNYALGHIWVLSVFFLPGLILLCGTLFDALKSGEGRDQPLYGSRPVHEFALYLALYTIATLAMVSLFTVSASEGSEFEKLRLHGRYVAPLLPLFLGFSFEAVRTGLKLDRLVSIAGLLLLCSFFALGTGLFKIYPWDYPELMGFFGPQAKYWSFDGTLWWPRWVILAAGILTFGYQAFKGLGLAPFAIFTAAWMLASQAQQWAWAGSQSEVTRGNVEIADAVEEIVSTTPQGSGVIFTTDRYGQTSALLMGMDSAQYVRSVDPNFVVSAKELPTGVNWALVPKDIKVKLAGFDVIALGAQHLYRRPEPSLLRPAPIAPDQTEVADMSGSEVVVELGGSHQGIVTSGFNAGEDWGAWTSGSDATIQLPHTISGKYTVTLNAWVHETNPSKVVKIQIGGASADIVLTGRLAKQSVTLDMVNPSDTLKISGQPVTVPGDGRKLAVAVSSITLQSVKR